jgi:hypothetical protein
MDKIFARVEGHVIRVTKNEITEPYSYTERAEHRWNETIERERVMDEGDERRVYEMKRQQEHRAA